MYYNPLQKILSRKVAVTIVEVCAVLDLLTDALVTMVGRIYPDIEKEGVVDEEQLRIAQ